jgi:broad specificity phosphatase PhoE
VSENWQQPNNVIWRGRASARPNDLQPSVDGRDLAVDGCERLVEHPAVRLGGGALAIVEDAGARHLERAAPIPPLSRLGRPQGCRSRLNHFLLLLRFNRLALPAASHERILTHLATRLLLVRHGVTLVTAENRFSGAEGVELSDDGRAQAGKLAARLAATPVAVIYTSPLSRAADTAEILARPHKLAPVVRDGLREISHGHWEGLTRAEVEARYPGEYEAWEADPFLYAPEGGETGLAVLARALPVIRSIVTAHRDATALVVSHKATLRLVLASLLGFEPRGYRDRLDQAPACLNIVEFRDEVRARLMLFNDTAHYTSEPARPAGRLSKWWDRPR